MSAWARRLRGSWLTSAAVLFLLIVIGVQSQNTTSYVSEAIARLIEGTGRVATVRQLASVDQLKARFNADKGRPRLILLFSPT